MPIGPIIRSMSHNKTRFALIILEIAITLAIVTNCVNMILDERSKMKRNSGFDDHDLLFVRTAPYAPEFREQQYRDNVIDADVRALSGLPGVKAVTNTNFIPWQGGGSSNSIKAAGRQETFQSQWYYATPTIFDTIDVKIIEGRGFKPGDYEYDPDQGPSMVVISKGLRDLLWRDGRGVGKVILDNDGTTNFNVVGVIDEFYNPYGWPIHEYAVFLPSRVGSYNRGLRYLIRVEDGAMKSVVPEIEKRLLSVNGQRTVEMRTIDDIKDETFTGSRLVVTAMSAVIVLLIFVTALGIVGITSMSVAERTRQIGTRRALGATRGDILRHFLVENWLVTTAGLLIGIVATYGLNFLLVSNVSSAKMEWQLVLIGMLLLWINGLVATVPPALRGSLVSPAVATRSI